MRAVVDGRGVPPKGGAHIRMARWTFTRLENKQRDRLRAYFKAIRAYTRAWVLTGFGTLASTLMRLPIPFLTGYIIDKVIPGKDYTKLNYIPTLLVLVTIAYVFLSYKVDYSLFRINRSITNMFRVKLFEHVQTLPVAYLSARETGYLMARLTDDPAQLTSIVNQILNISMNAVTFIVGTAAIFIINTRLAAVSMLLLPFFLWSQMGFQRRIRNADSQEKEQNAFTSHVLKESISAIRVTKLFLLHKREARRYVHNLKKALGFATRSFNSEYMMIAAGSFFAALGPLTVVWYGGHEVLHGRLTIGQLVAFSSLLGFLYAPARSIVSSNVAFTKAMVSLNRVADLLEEKDEQAHVGAAKITANPPCFSLKYRDVSFSYNGSAPTLRDVTLDVAHKEVVALVGPNGAGKTTLVNLMTLFYTPSAGTITIGGVDIRSIPLRQLRRYITVMSQTPFLFSASIYDNILAGRTDANREEVMNAAKRANAYRFITSLPQGFDTQVGEDGYCLSGGQRQLICMARVILRDSPILVLDEPTSAIDSVTERLLQESLRSFIRDRTTIIISHRLSAVLDVNRIIVFESGMVTSVGSHSDVFEHNSYYAAIVRAQIEITPAPFAVAGAARPDLQEAFK
jgi:ABC-type multidrug transport system fused ATPase/permease subunit